jgi:two-component system sensor histidine kinase BarA
VADQDHQGKPGLDLPARDEEVAVRAAGGDAALASELFRALMAQLPAELALLRRLLAARDWEGLDDLAHRLRGATAYCGVPALEAALGELSQAAKQSSVQGAGDASSRVQLEVHRLQEWSASLPGPARDDPLAGAL